MGKRDGRGGGECGVVRHQDARAKERMSSASGGDDDESEDGDEGEDGD